LQVYWRSTFLTELSDAAIATLIDHFGTITSPLSALLIEQFGGAVGRVAPGATAFDHRDAEYNLAIIARWTDPAEADRHIAWARGVGAAMQPFSRGVYVNYLGVGEGAERARAAFGQETRSRLAALKAAYDPDNLFRFNQTAALLA
jgi:FAD/FMN-containing dehydrogenase